MSISQKIKDKISSLEIERKIKVLIAAEGGSRAWGFSSEMSDWDLRIIYSHSTEEYLKISDNIPPNFELRSEGGIEVFAWEIRKALQLYSTSGFAIYECLNSPIIHFSQTDFLVQLTKLEAVYFNGQACALQYLSMSKKNYKKHFSKEEPNALNYLYVLRPLFCSLWIAQIGSFPPADMKKLMAGLIIPDKVSAVICELITAKSSGKQFSNTASINLLDAYIAETSTSFKPLLTKTSATNSSDTSRLDNLFRNTLRQLFL